MQPNTGNKKWDNGSTKEWENGSTKEWESDGSQEPNNGSVHEQVCQLQEQLLCSQHKLRELEEEVRHCGLSLSLSLTHSHTSVFPPPQVETLRADKELLLSRNQTLTEELQKREAAVSCQLLAKLGLKEDWFGSAPSWWLTDSSEYEVRAREE